MTQTVKSMPGGACSSSGLYTRRASRHCLQSGLHPSEQCKRRLARRRLCNEAHVHFIENFPHGSDHTAVTGTVCAFVVRACALFGQGSEKNCDCDQAHIRSRCVGWRLPPHVTTHQADLKCRSPPHVLGPGHH